MKKGETSDLLTVKLWKEKEKCKIMKIMLDILKTRGIISVFLVRNAIDRKSRRYSSVGRATDL